MVSYVVLEAKELEKRLIFDGPRDPRVEKGGLSYKFPRGSVAAVEQSAAVAKEVNWQGSLKYLARWQQYVLHYTRQE